MRTERAACNGLIVLVVIGGASAVGLVGGGIDFPADWLSGSPFESYVVPGLILGLIVGGSQLVAAWALLRREEGGWLAAGLAGCIMVGWIVGEVLIAGSERGVMRNLQLAYLLIGLLEANIAAPRVRGWVRLSWLRDEAIH